MKSTCCNQPRVIFHSPVLWFSSKPATVRKCSPEYYSSKLTEKQKNKKKPDALTAKILARTAEPELVELFCAGHYGVDGVGGFCVRIRWNREVLELKQENRCSLADAQISQWSLHHTKVPFCPLDRWLQTVGGLIPTSPQLCDTIQVKVIW